MRQTPFKGTSALSFGAKLGKQAVKLELSNEITSTRAELSKLFNMCCAYDEKSRPNFPSIRKALLTCK